MSNDNKTLADVQPGGMVRLGDQAERARFEAWHCEKFKTRWLTGAPTRDMHNGAYAENYGPAEQQARWELWQAAWESALSAQPSPGGQDALAEAARRVISDVDSGDYHGEISESTYAALEAALATRQPVSETVAYQQGFRDGQDRTCTVAASQPVGEPVAWVHEEDPSRVISASQKATALRDQGASGSSVRPYSVPAYLHVPPAQAVDLGQTFQAGVAEWMGQCFLPSLYSNMTERGDRLLEEVLELLQAHGYDRARVPTLVDYVFGRPVGEPAQEVGGVMVTLAGYCWVAGLDMDAAGDAELARINQPEVMDKIRRKQEAKNELHFDTPLPGHAAPTAQTVDLGTERMFYIQDTRQFVGNCPMWWGPNGSGYVTRLDEAGRYTEQEAIKQNRTRDTDIPWPCAEIDAIARRTVDCQHMRPRAERLAELALVDSQAVGNG